MIIRKTFPQVYALESPKKGKYWLGLARSAKWGLHQRKIFTTEELALKYARDLEAQVIQNGKQSDILGLDAEYGAKGTDRLACPAGMTLEGT